MLFSSYIFLLVFLPLVVLLYRLQQQRPWVTRSQFFVVVSIVFYGYWNIWHVPLILGSVLVNYWLGSRLTRTADDGKRKSWLVVGLVFNLALIGLYKYSGFFVGEVSRITGAQIDWPGFVLPLGISFFTFQQIAYLVDAYRREAPSYRLSDYAAFVLFFPQLIAGPIVHHRQLIEQLGERESRGLRADHFAVGITILVIGLFKKVVVADTLAPIADNGFAAAESERLVAAEAWLATLAYTCQLYFDFSGYSDMAIGLGRMFSIQLPLNFNSPYRACSIVDFWRRWHMTLSAFLRDYLYIPLGGSRCSKPRRYVNLLVTMLLGGLWHGAGWTFVLWGLMHGGFLCINHAWSSLRKKFFGTDRTTTPGRAASWVITMAGVIAAWVVFRAESLDGAGNMLTSLVAFHSLSAGTALSTETVEQLAMVAVLFVSCAWLPNTQELMQRALPFDTEHHRSSPDSPPDPAPVPSLLRSLAWSPSAARGAATAVLFVVVVTLLTRVQTFLYFQF